MDTNSYHQQMIIAVLYLCYLVELSKLLISLLVII